MSKVYQNFSSLSTPFLHIYNNLLLFFLKFAHFLPFDFIKFLPIVCLSIASKESVIFSDLASFISPKLNIDFDSSIRNISVSFKHFSTNLAISKIDGHKEPFYILTNGSPKRAIKDYSYRFDSIEFLFKSFKTNGFFLEETQINNLYSFNSLYTCLCINHVLFTMVGIDYSKNRNCYKYKIRNSRIVNGKRRKEHSFFHIGLILLNAALDGTIRIFQRFILYDV